MRNKKNVALLKSGIKKIGSFCSRTRSSDSDGAAEFPSVLKEDDQETERSLFDDDDDDDDDSCLWLSSSASPSSFFDEGSSCCSSLFLDKCIISSEISCSSSREVMDLASWILELEKDENFMADLDLEYCIIPSSFPSPSFVTCCSSNREAEEVMDEGPELEHLDDDEPVLFWPFDEGKLSWNPDETWISFAMSPRKDIVVVDSTVSSSKLTATTPSKCPESEQKRHDDHHQPTTRIFPKLRRISSLVVPRRRMSSSSDSKPAAAAAATKRAAAKKVLLPSRLVKASESSCANAKTSMKVVPLEIMMAKNKLGHGAANDGAFLFDSIGRDEVPIEKLVGLEEFDGHEGMDSSQLDDDGLINGDGGDANLFSLVE